MYEVRIKKPGRRKRDWRVGKKIKFMKKVILLFALLYLTIANAQDKPRRFTKTIALCPIDMSKVSTESLLKQATIDTTMTTIQVASGVAIPKNGIVSLDKSGITLTDTIYKYTVLSSPGLIFSIEQQVGSFTIIKLWSYTKAENTKTLSELDYFKLNTNKQRFLPIELMVLERI